MSAVCYTVVFLIAFKSPPKNTYYFIDVRKKPWLWVQCLRTCPQNVCMFFYGLVLCPVILTIKFLTIHSESVQNLAHVGLPLGLGLLHALELDEHQVDLANNAADYTLHPVNTLSQPGSKKSRINFN